MSLPGSTRLHGRRPSAAPQAEPQLPRWPTPLLRRRRTDRFATDPRRSHSHPGPGGRRAGAAIMSSLTALGEEWSTLANGELPDTLGGAPARSHPSRGASGDAAWPTSDGWPCGFKPGVAAVLGYVGLPGWGGFELAASAAPALARRRPPLEHLPSSIQPPVCKAAGLLRTRPGRLSCLYRVTVTDTCPARRRAAAPAPAAAGVFGANGHPRGVRLPGGRRQARRLV